MRKRRESRAKGQGKEREEKVEQKGKEKKVIENSIEKGRGEIGKKTEEN